MADEGRFVLTNMKLQVENGHTKIVNEVLEQLVKVGLLGSEYQVILLVIRKTWGWQKTEDHISLTQMELATGLSRPTITKTIKNLVLKKILVKGTIPLRQGNTFKFNKYYNQWLVNPPQLVKDTDITSKGRLTKLVKGSLHTKEIKKTKEKDLILNKKKAEKIKQELRERWGKRNVNA